MLLLGRDLDHRVERLPGLDVGEAPPGGDLPQTIHVGGGDQQVAGGEEAGGSTAARTLWARPNQRDSPGEHVTRLLHLVARDVMLHVRLVDPSLDVDDLLPVIV